MDSADRMDGLCSDRAGLRGHELALSLRLALCLSLSLSLSLRLALCLSLSLSLSLRLALCLSDSLSVSLSLFRPITEPSSEQESNNFHPVSLKSGLLSRGVVRQRESETPLGKHSILSLGQNYSNPISHKAAVRQDVQIVLKS